MKKQADKDVFSKRLKSARILARLTQEELASQVDITKNAISKYEKGEMMAEPGMLKKLSETLKVAYDYLTRPFDVEFVKVEFRKKTRLPKTEEYAIGEQIRIQVENYLQTEEILNIDYTFDHPFPGARVRTKEDMEKYAQLLIENWHLGINGIPSVYRMLEDNEIKVIELTASTDFDGWSALANGKYPVIVINSNITTERKRFTAIHELAHLLFDFDESLSDSDTEKLCHYFAGAVLLPETMMYRLFGTSRVKISDSERRMMNKTYGISHQAFMYRALELKIIKPYTYQQFQYLIRNDRQEKALSLYQGEEKAVRFLSLIYRAIAEDYVTLGKAAELSGLPEEELAEVLN